MHDGHEHHDHSHDHGHSHSHDHEHTHPHGDHEHAHSHPHDHEHTHGHEHDHGDHDHGEHAGHDHHHGDHTHAHEGSAEHNHSHDDNHSHAHAHDEDCDCGHDHGEDCDCDHEHGEDCDCGHDHGEHDHAHEAEISALESIEPGVVAVTVHTHDGAVVASGALIVYSSAPHELRHEVADAVEAIAAQVGHLGGVVGHVKASFVATSYDMLSVTEAGGEVDLKRAPDLEVKIGITAIAFNVPMMTMRELVAESLKALT